VVQLSAATTIYPLTATASRSRLTRRVSSLGCYRACEGAADRRLQSTTQSSNARSYACCPRHERTLLPPYPRRDRSADAGIRAVRGVHRGPDYRLVAPRLRLLIATAMMTTTTPTRSRASPILWTLNPDECTDVANLKITPTTASTIPIASSPIPDLVFTDPQPSLLAIRACAHPSAGWRPRSGCPRVPEAELALRHDRCVDTADAIWNRAALQRGWHKPPARRPRYAAAVPPRRNARHGVYAVPSTEAGGVRKHIGLRADPGKRARAAADVRVPVSGLAGGSPAEVQAWHWRLSGRWSRSLSRRVASRASAVRSP
jgi:hypothetical protein